MSALTRCCVFSSSTVRHSFSMAAALGMSEKPSPNAQPADDSEADL